MCAPPRPHFNVAAAESKFRPLNRLATFCPFAGGSNFRESAATDQDLNNFEGWGQGGIDLMLLPLTSPLNCLATFCPSTVALKRFYSFLLTLSYVHLYTILYIYIRVDSFGWPYLMLNNIQVYTFASELFCCCSPYRM